MNDTEYDYNKNYLLELKTVQSSAFRILIEALKEILTDSNMEFDESGMKIVAMDASHTVLVHLRLDGTSFEHFYCKQKLVLGINMMNFFKLIKTMNNTDTLTLFLEEENPNELGIRIENGDKNTVTNYKLNLMDLNEDKIQIPPATFTSVITMPSSDFQKICRDMNNLADTIEIKSVDNHLLFNCKGDFASQETIMGETTTGMNYIKQTQSNDIVQGVFALKHLVLFTKCTNLCNSIEIYLKNDYPLIIKYNVASLGEIKLCLAPQNIN